MLKKSQIKSKNKWCLQKLMSKSCKTDCFCVRILFSNYFGILASILNAKKSTIVYLFRSWAGLTYYILTHYKLHWHWRKKKKKKRQKSLARVLLSFSGSLKRIITCTKMLMKLIFFKKLILSQHQNRWCKS